MAGALSTDLYELTMMAGYFAAGLGDHATFDILGLADEAAPAGGTPLLNLEGLEQKVNQRLDRSRA